MIEPPGGPRPPGRQEIRRLQEVLSGFTQADRRDFIVVPQENRPYVGGTVLPQLGVIRTATSQGGVVVPVAAYANEPMKYVHTFIGLDEYLGPLVRRAGREYDNDEWIGVLVSEYPQEQLLIALALLNHSLNLAWLYERMMNDFDKLLPPALQEFYRPAIASDEHRVFAARQPILRAIREVLLFQGQIEQGLPFPLDVTGPMLAHAFATQVGHVEESGPELWPTVRASVAMEVTQNYLFNQREDVYPRLDRYSRLWDQYGAKLQRTKLRKTPAELIEEATGVQTGDIFAVAMVLLGRNLSWQAGQPFYLDPYAGIGMDRDIFDRAMAVFTADIPKLIAELRNAASTDWAMLPFERHPVVRLGNGAVLVLDQEFLVSAVTSGLYWRVFDHELSTQGKDAADLFSAAYAEMLEAMAEDILSVMAPPLIGGPGKTFYAEDDVMAAYGSGVRRTDAIIDFGSVFALFEVQKGQVSLDARAIGRFDKFVADTERMVFEKARQLQGTGEAIIKDEAALTKSQPVPGRRILPVAVEGNTYPVNPITTEYVAVELKKRNLLTDPRFLPVAIVDLGELEMLEGLRDNAHVSIIDALRGWQTGPGWRFSLRNHLLERYGPDFLVFRPSRMAGARDNFTRDVAARLKVQPDAKST